MIYILKLSSYIVLDLLLSNYQFIYNFLSTHEFQQQNQKYTYYASFYRNC